MPMLVLVLFDKYLTCTHLMPMLVLVLFDKYLTCTHAKSHTIPILKQSVGIFSFAVLLLLWLMQSSPIVLLGSNGCPWSACTI